MPRQATLRVLLVEDSHVLRERIADAIRELADIELVSTVDSESNAISTLRRQKIDVLVLDLHLRQGSGFGVLRSFAQNAPRPKVIIMSNYNLPAYQETARSLGVTHFLDKAHDYSQLPGILSELAKKKLQPGAV